jgi:tRNA A-37 threonylcarbamoyl transferase component Bud32
MRKNKKNSRVTSVLRDLSSDNLTNSCKLELENFFNVNFQLNSVKFSSFSIGAHLISIPLKVIGLNDSEAVTYFVKVVTEKGLDMLNIILAMKSIGLKILVGVQDAFYDRFESTYDAVNFEHICLKSFTKAGILVPKPEGVYKLSTCSLLVTEFIEGMPLGNVEITPAEIYKVFNVIKKLRENTLVHGDIKLDNFIVDRNNKIFLLDCMKCNGSLEQALNYDLMCAIYCLTRKFDASCVVHISQKFFSRGEVKDALKFLHLASARLDSIFENGRTKEIILACAE